MMKASVWVPMLFAVLFIALSVRLFSWIISTGINSFGAAGAVSMVIAMGFAIAACVNARDGV